MNEYLKDMQYITSKFGCNIFSYEQNSVSANDIIKGGCYSCSGYEEGMKIWQAWNEFLLKIVQNTTITTTTSTACFDYPK